MNNNLVFLIGKIDKEPKYEFVNGNSKMTLTLSISRNNKDEKDFITVYITGDMANNAYLKKGRLLGIGGKIQTKSCNENGERNYIAEVIADQVLFLSDKTVEEEKNSDNEQNQEIER